MMEIERKYLITNHKDIDIDILSELHITQGYIQSSKVISNRIRKTVSDVGTTYTFCTKISTDSMVIRYEFETDLSEEVGEQLLSTCDTLSKTRCMFVYAGMEWSIDVFSNGLMLAEIELPHENFKLSKPHFIGLEVTNDPTYLNVNII